MGLPQHQSVVLDAPASLITISLAQGIQTIACPFFSLAMLVLLSHYLLQFLNASFALFEFPLFFDEYDLFY